MNKVNKHNTYNTIYHWQSFRLKLIIEGIIVGALTGLLIVSYRITLEEADQLRQKISLAQLQNYKLIPIWFIILILGAYIVGLMVKKEPMIKGSGIPQIEGVLQRRLSMNWLSVIILKFIGGTIALGAGLSLGREGPSIQLGGAVGQGFSKVLKRIKIEEKYLITSGASAGLAAAFNAPFAGVMFALEEVHKHFSPLVLLSAMAASLTSDFISKHFFGLKPVLNIQHISSLPLNSYGYIILLGIIVGVFGVIYNSTLLRTLNIYDKKMGIPVQYKLMIPFVMAGVLLFILPQVLGGGHALIDLLIEGSFTMKMLIIILIVKFTFSMISFGSGAPGGIFFPLLVIGALTGAIYGNVLVHFFSFSPEFINNFIILAMAGYFTSIVRAPITGIILITEMTGSFTHLLSLSIVSITAYIVADLLKSEPIYEALLKRQLRKDKCELTGSSKNKIILEIPVFLGSEMDGKMIKDLSLSTDCLLVGIRRGEDEIIPKGNTFIYSGDYLIVLVDENKAATINKELLKLGGTSRSI
ncbi:chloride ion channel protein [Clostridium polyendosporum]|uniref:Chloride ion channel protein n=1 Tax=Clostridium polyendosporum TaxID=69208 RepID=A0A919RWB9_9CLOT|nr:H(+)/Cl(-) exchange transporter ClcA [Clostridium polyendosporum]GIM27591.1 chloride ion channel protein [Clostridium polyendosporum]